MEVALTIRKRANCLHARVGAVLVFGNRIVSTGFNGTPAGFPNCLEAAASAAASSITPKKEEKIKSPIRPWPMAPSS